MTRQAFTYLELLDLARRERLCRAMPGTVPYVWACTYNRRTDSVPRRVRKLLADGLLAEPPEGASFFTVTEAGLEALKAGT